MSIKTIALLAVKIVALTLLLFVFFFGWLVVLLLHRHYRAHITSEKRLHPVG